jgi:hypothetical protein
MSEAGLRVLVNPETYVTNEELKYLTRQREEREAQSQVAEARRRRHDAARASTIPDDSAAGASPFRHGQSEAPSVTSAGPSALAAGWGGGRHTASHVRGPAYDPHQQAATPGRSALHHMTHDELEDIVGRVVRKVGDPSQHDRIKRHVVEDLQQRMRRMDESRSPPPSPGELSAGSDVEEVRYNARVMSLEDKEIANTFSTVVVVVADLIELMVSDILGFHSFETKNLAKEMRKAVDAGSFEPAVRHFCETEASGFMRNPYNNALLTFASVTLRNHMNHQRGVVVRTKPPKGQAKAKSRAARQKVDSRAQAKRKKRRRPEPIDEEPSEDEKAEDDEEDQEDDNEIPPFSPASSLHVPRRRPPTSHRRPPPGVDELPPSRRSTPRQSASPRSAVKHVVERTRPHTPPLSPLSPSPSLPPPVPPPLPQMRAPSPGPSEPSSPVDHAALRAELNMGSRDSSVIDPLTGHARADLSQVKLGGGASAMNDMIGNMGKMGGHVRTFTQIVKADHELKEERDNLGDAPTRRRH